MTLTDKDLVVDPGGDTVTEVSVRNRSEIVEEFEVTVVGAAAPYAQTLPPTISVYPGDVATAEVQLRPPFDTAVSTGKQPFGVFVRSKDNPECSAVAEGQLTVGSINLLDVRLLPSRSRGRWRARHSVELHNEGTEPLRVRLGTIDSEQKLSFGLAPRELNIKPGSASEAFLKVRPQKPKIYGQPILHPFEVSYRRKADKASALLGASAGGDVEATVPATFEQRAIIAKWMIVVALLAILIAAVIIFRARNNDPEIPEQTSIGSPGAPTNVAVDSGRIGADVPFRISWEPSPDAPAADRYVVQFIETNDLEALVEYSPLFVQVVEAPSTEVTNFEQLQAANPDIAEGSSSVEVCVLVQAEADVGTPEAASTTRSVLVGGVGTGSRPDLPAPACGTHFGDTCSPPVIVSAVASSDSPDRIIVEVDYDEENCTAAEGAVLTVLVNGNNVAPENAQRVRSIPIDVSGILPEDDGYTIVVQFASEPSEPALVTQQSVDAANGQFEEENPPLTPEPEPSDPNLVRPQGFYAVVFASSEDTTVEYDGPDSPMGNSIKVASGAALNAADLPEFDHVSVVAGLSPIARTTRLQTPGLVANIELLAGTFGSGEEFIVVTLGFVSADEAGQYCNVLQPQLDMDIWRADFLEFRGTPVCTIVST